MVVRGNGVAGGGYSPFGMTGDATMSLYGPMSPSRAYTSPVVLQPTSYGPASPDAVGISFSTPYLPRATSVVYPTRGNVANGFREQRTPPWWDSGYGWIDQD
jgi:hypothetical protein